MLSHVGYGSKRGSIRSASPSVARSSRLPVAYNWITFVYSAEIDSCEPPDCDEATLEWAQISHLANVRTLPTDLFICDLVAKGQVFALDARCDADTNLLRLENEISGQVFDHPTRPQ